MDVVGFAEGVGVVLRGTSCRYLCDSPLDFKLEKHHPEVAMIKSFLFCFTRHRTNKTRISFLPGLLVYLTLPRILLLYPFKIYESFPRLLNMLATVRDDALTHRHSWAQLLLKKTLSERKWRFLYNTY